MPDLTRIFLLLWISNAEFTVPGHKSMNKSRLTCRSFLSDMYYPATYHDGVVHSQQIEN